MSPKKQMVWEAEPLILFTFNQGGSRTLVRIAARRDNFERMVNNIPHKDHALIRQVKFQLCGLDLSNSFTALSTVHSLVKVFEHRQFGIGDKHMSMRFPLTDDEHLRLFCRLVSYAERYDGLELGWTGRRNGEDISRSHTFHIGYVHAMRNALHRAMGWLSPSIAVAHAFTDEKTTPFNEQGE
jgi:hypothetical protein